MVRCRNVMNVKYFPPLCVTAGLDYGGVRREFFQLLCCQLFDCTRGLFVRFGEDKQGLVSGCGGLVGVAGE